MERHCTRNFVNSLLLYDQEKLDFLQLGAQLGDLLGYCIKWWGGGINMVRAVVPFKPRIYGEFPILVQLIEIRFGVVDVIVSHLFVLSFKAGGFK